MGETHKAATCFIENLKRKDHEQVECSEIQDAVMYLAKYYKALERYEESMNYCRRLQDYSGTYREEAMALIREINSIMQVSHQQHAGGFMMHHGGHKWLVNFNKFINIQSLGVLRASPM